MDNVLPGGNLNLLNMLGVVMLVIILLRLILSIFQALFVMKTESNRCDIDFELLSAHSETTPNFFDNMRTGEIISRISDAVKIRVFINDVSIGLILNVFILIVSFALMFTFYFRLAIVMLISSVPLYAGMYILSDNLNREN
ncbi:MAG: ABC transporter transmembrane domain-containing protein [Bacteroidales bacterium]